ncbi:MAG: hypothetical protein HS115_09860 [Spirochaetales bacterium]|nr:hypothetical protein [Spirochaetales bacterium]
MHFRVTPVLLILFFSCMDARSSLHSPLDPESKEGQGIFYYLVRNALFGELIELTLHSSTIYDQTNAASGYQTVGNGDGLPASGETIRLAPVLRNSGQRTVQGVRIRATSVSGVEATATEIALSDVSSGNSLCMRAGLPFEGSLGSCVTTNNTADYHKEVLRFVLSASGTRVIPLELQDSAGRRWPAAITLNVQ